MLPEELSRNDLGHALGGETESQPDNGDGVADEQPAVREQKSMERTVSNNGEDSENLPGLSSCLWKLGGTQPEKMKENI